MPGLNFTVFGFINFEVKKPLKYQINHSVFVSTMRDAKEIGFHLTES